MTFDTFLARARELGKAASVYALDNGKYRVSIAGCGFNGQPDYLDATSLEGAYRNCEAMLARVESSKGRGSK